MLIVVRGNVENENDTSKGVLHVKCSIVKMAMLLVAAICAAAISPTFAGDLEDYRFRYDFSAGVNNFIGSSAQLSDPLTSGGTPVYTRVYGPNGDSTAVHPTSVDWGSIGAVLDADWTLAMFVRPGSVEGGILAGVGRLNNDNKKSNKHCNS